MEWASPSTGGGVQLGLDAAETRKRRRLVLRVADVHAIPSGAWSINTSVISARHDAFVELEEVEIRSAVRVDARRIRRSEHTAIVATAQDDTSAACCECHIRAGSRTWDADRISQATRWRDPNQNAGGASSSASSHCASTHDVSPRRHWHVDSSTDQPRCRRRLAGNLDEASSAEESSVQLQEVQVPQAVRCCGSYRPLILLCACTHWMSSVCMQQVLRVLRERRLLRRELQLPGLLEHARDRGGSAAGDRCSLGEEPERVQAEDRGYGGADAGRRAWRERNSGALVPDASWPRQDRRWRSRERW